MPAFFILVILSQKSEMELERQRSSLASSVTCILTEQASSALPRVLISGWVWQALQSGVQDAALQPAASVYFAMYLVQRGRFLEASVAEQAAGGLAGTRCCLSP